MTFSKLELGKLRELYADGVNITHYVRDRMQESQNSELAIELAYDLQSGSYIRYFQEREGRLSHLHDAMAEVLAKQLKDAQTVLDVGTGECTTLGPVAARAMQQVPRIMACDLSWSRIRKGRDFLSHYLPEGLASRAETFVGTMLSLPLPDKAVDVVWSSHALEPNGGREHEILSELFRVTARKLCLFEPSFENNTAEGRDRMERHGYVRGIPDVVAELGGTLDACIPMPDPVNPLNPTHAYVITPPGAAAASGPAHLVCPITGERLQQRDGVLYAERPGLAYPILVGVPLLCPSSAIVATALSEMDVVKRPPVETREHEIC